MEEFIVHRKRMIPTGEPSSPLGKKMQLSSLDHFMEKHHLKLVLYYKTRTMLPLGELTKKIRRILSPVTSCFPVTTGRLIKDEDGKWEIKCNDAGVRFIEAIAKGSVESWLENLDEEKEKRLIYWEDWYHIPYYWATFYFMVTEFEEGGMAIGLSCSHLLADPMSATLLIKSWADKVLTGSISIPPFFHPLPNKTLSIEKPLYEPNNNLINHYKFLLESPSPSISQKLRTISFSFTEHMVYECINFTRFNGPTNDLNPSPFVALIGIIWTCISRVKGETYRLIDMSIGLDTRKTLGLDQGFFGNCMIYIKVNGDNISVNDIQTSTKVIGKEIEKVNKDGVVDLIEWLNNYKNISPPSSLDMGNLVVLNLENLDPYSAIFVKGYEPIRIGYYNESSINDEGKVLVLPSHPSEGKLSRIVMVTLPNNEVVKLCEDKLLSHISPNIIMGP